MAVVSWPEQRDEQSQGYMLVSGCIYRQVYTYQWHSKGRAWPSKCPAKAPCSSHSCHAILRERETNGLAYSRCPANANDLATPLIHTSNKECSKIIHKILQVSILLRGCSKGKGWITTVITSCWSYRVQWRRASSCQLTGNLQDVCEYIIGYLFSILNGLDPLLNTIPANFPDGSRCLAIALGFSRIPVLQKFYAKQHI